MLAASLAQELVSSHHWTDAYWIDMQGVTNVVLAGTHSCWAGFSFRLWPQQVTCRWNSGMQADQCSAVAPDPQGYFDVSA